MQSEAAAHRRAKPCCLFINPPSYGLSFRASSRNWDIGCIVHLLVDQLICIFFQHYMPLGRRNFEPGPHYGRRLTSRGVPSQYKLVRARRSGTQHSESKRQLELLAPRPGQRESMWTKQITNSARRSSTTPTRRSLKTVPHDTTAFFEACAASHNCSTTLTQVREHATAECSGARAIP